MNSVQSPVPAPALSRLPEAINQAVLGAIYARQAVQCALRAGGLLSEAKALVPHGQWEQWLG